MARRPKPPQFLKLKIFVGLMFAAVGVYCLVTYERFESVAVHAQGKVIDVKSEHRRTGRRNGQVTISRPVVEFEVPPSTTKVTATAQVPSSMSDFNAGDSIAIEFDPRLPQETVRLDTGPSFLDLGVGLFGVLLIGVATMEKIKWSKAQKDAGDSASSSQGRPAAAT